MNLMLEHRRAMRWLWALFFAVLGLALTFFGAWPAGLPTLAFAVLVAWRAVSGK